MKISELIENFEIYTTNEEEKLLKQLYHPSPLHSFSEHDQFVIETLIRKNLVIKIGNTNPVVIINEL
jgi:hypothetical protein